MATGHAVTRRFRRSTAFIGLGLALLAGAACRHETTEPTGRRPPYIAIVARAETAVLTEPGVQYSYRIKALTTGATYDTLVAVAPSDTVIVSVDPGVYEVSLANLPEKCVSRYGVVQEIAVPEGTNTAIARFFISCNVPLVVRVYTTGLVTAPELVWQVEKKDGSSPQTGIVRTRDENLIFTSVAPGEYRVSVWSAPEHCVLTNNGGRYQLATVPPTGNARLVFTVVCSKIANRPTLLDFRWTYSDSVAAFIAKVEDPDFNIASYYFDLTDCEGTSVLPGGVRERGGMASDRTRLTRTPTIIGAFELPVKRNEFAARCASLRVQDADGNTTPVVERLAAPPVGEAPEATSFNAILFSEQLLSTRVEAVDPDDDLFGTFVAARLRDGTLGPPDGKPDLGVYNAAGYQGTTIPDLPLGGRILFTDVYAVIVYLVDRRGNFRKYIDEDTFR